jgi:ABC-type sulfate/molybdate transport systems ATPase subunit
MTLLDVDVQYRREDFSLAAKFALHSSWTVLFGPSGAGKTTLLRILAGLAQPQQGRILLEGRTITDTAANIAVAPGTRTNRRVGFVTQNAALFPHLTASENVAFGLATLPRETRAARVQEMLSLFDAEHLAQRKASALSGGERQRVALARALAPQPALLLLDEPFAALDAEARVIVAERLRTTAVPILSVSHDLADAWQANTDVLVLESGRIQSQGEARTVLADYRNRLLAQLGALEIHADR